jgi:hypothetical protein
MPQNKNEPKPNLFKIEQVLKLTTLPPPNSCHPAGPEHSKHDARQKLPLESRRHPNQGILPLGEQHRQQPKEYFISYAAAGPATSLSSGRRPCTAIG